MLAVPNGSTTTPGLGAKSKEKSISAKRAPLSSNELTFPEILGRALFEWLGPRRFPLWEHFRVALRGQARSLPRCRLLDNLTSE
jgi:hypothetical protein